MGNGNACNTALPGIIKRRSPQVCRQQKYNGAARKMPRKNVSIRSTCMGLNEYIHSDPITNVDISTFVMGDIINL